MRAACFALIAGSVASTGCSALVAVTGREVTNLPTRAAVHERFGTPAVAVEVDGEASEEFTTRRKIPEIWKVQGYGMVGFFTCGFSEFVCFPYELGMMGWRTLVGQRLRYTYDESGNVTSVRRDGELLCPRRTPPLPAKPPTPPAEVLSRKSDPNLLKRGTERFQVRLVDGDRERP